MKWAGGGGGQWLNSKQCRVRCGFAGGGRDQPRSQELLRKVIFLLFVFQPHYLFIQPIIPLKGLILLPRYNVFCLDSVFHLLFLPGLAVFPKVGSKLRTISKTRLVDQILHCADGPGRDCGSDCDSDRIVCPPPKFGLPRLPLPRRTRAPGKSGGR